jgi:hypothetical protein
MRERKRGVPIKGGKRERRSSGVGSMLGRWLEAPMASVASAKMVETAAVFLCPKVEEGQGELGHGWAKKAEWA